MDRRKRKPGSDSGDTTGSAELFGVAGMGAGWGTRGWVDRRTRVVAQFAGGGTRDVFFRAVFVPGTRHGDSAEREHRGGCGRPRIRWEKRLLVVRSGVARCEDRCRYGRGEFFGLVARRAVPGVLFGGGTL